MLAVYLNKIEILPASSKSLFLTAYDSDVSLLWRLYQIQSPVPIVINVEIVDVKLSLPISIPSFGRSVDKMFIILISC